MQKYIEILEEIEKARADILDTTKTEKEMGRAYLRETAHKGTPEEIEKARADYHAAIERYNAETVHNENVNIKIAILRDNAKQAFFAENIKAICDIWNKYAGKAHGPKTADKIRDELKSATGCYVYIGNKYRVANIGVISDSATKNCFYDLEFYPKWTGEDYSALINNKIQRLDPSRFRVLCCGEYVENVEEHAEKIRKAHSEALEAEKAFTVAMDIYNDLIRGNMERANGREGIKKWIIN